MKTALNAEETRICELMGVNPHEFIEAREGDLVEARNRESQQGDKAKIDQLMGISQ